MFGIDDVAAATLGAGIIGGVASAYGANRAGKDAKAATEAQIGWERERAKNAHQWEVEDLKKAGLNPILSAGGSGAVTGGISAPMPDRSGYTEAGEKLINSALAAYDISLKKQKNDAEVDNLNAATEQTQTKNKLTEAQIISEFEKQGLISKQTATEISKQSLNYAAANKMDTEIKAITAKLQTEIEELKAKIELAKENKDVTEQKKLQEQYNTKMQQFTYWFDKGERVAATMINATNSAANVIGAIL